MGGPRAARWVTAGLAVWLLLGGGAALAAGKAAESEGEFRILPYGPPESIVDAGSGASPDDPLSGINAVEEYARTHLADVFAGLYLEGADAGRTGTLVIAVAGTLSSQQQQALQDLAGDVPVRFRTVDYPLADLERLQQEITMAMADLERQGVEIAIIGVDVKSNRVQVTVTGSADEAAAILGQRFDGAMLQVVEGEPPVLLTPRAGAGDAAADAPDAAGDGGGTGDDAAEPARKPSFWQRLLDAIRSWWQALFG